MLIVSAPDRDFKIISRAIKMTIFTLWTHVTIISCFAFLAYKLISRNHFLFLNNNDAIYVKTAKEGLSGLISRDNITLKITPEWKLLQPTDRIGVHDLEKPYMLFYYVTDTMQWNSVRCKTSDYDVILSAINQNGQFNRVLCNRSFAKGGYGKMIAVWEKEKEHPMSMLKLYALKIIKTNDTQSVRDACKGTDIFIQCLPPNSYNKNVKKP